MGTCADPLRQRETEDCNLPSVCSSFQAATFRGVGRPQAAGPVGLQARARRASGGLEKAGASCSVTRWGEVHGDPGRSGRDPAGRDPQETVTLRKCTDVLSLWGPGCAEASGHLTSNGAVTGHLPAGFGAHCPDSGSLGSAPPSGRGPLSTATAVTKETQGTAQRTSALPHGHWVWARDPRGIPHAGAGRRCGAAEPRAGRAASGTQRVAEGTRPPWALGVSLCNRSGVHGAGSPSAPVPVPPSPTPRSLPTGPLTGLGSHTAWTRFHVTTRPVRKASMKFASLPVLHEHEKSDSSPVPLFLRGSQPRRPEDELDSRSWAVRTPGTAPGGAEAASWFPTSPCS